MVGMVGCVEGLGEGQRADRYCRRAKGDVRVWGREGEDGGSGHEESIVDAHFSLGVYQYISGRRAAL